MTMQPLTFIEDIDWERIDGVLDSPSDRLVNIATAGGLDPNTSFQGISMENVKLSGIDVRGINFSNTDLRGTELRNAIVDGSTILTGAIMDREDIEALSDPALFKSKPELVVVLCLPRGFCAGVVRGIAMIEKAIEEYGTPIYILGDIVPNELVTNVLRTQGAIFVGEISEIPNNTEAPFVCSPHGVPQSVWAEAETRNLRALDITCPLVAKMHREITLHHEHNRQVLLIGRYNHPEVIGTLGQLPAGTIKLIETEEEAKLIVPVDPRKLAYVTQTTRSIDSTVNIITILKSRFPDISGPPKEGLCYAATNREDVVKKVAPMVDALIVAGSSHSSSALRLREISEEMGCKTSILAERASDIDWNRLEHISSLGITAGASAPEVSIEEILDALTEHYTLRLETVSAIEETNFLSPDDLP